MSKSDLLTSYDETERFINDELRELISNNTSKEIIRAGKAGEVFDDNMNYDLYRLSFYRKDYQDDRSTCLKLHFKPTSFYTFALLNQKLDEQSIIRSGKKTTIREAYNLDSNNLSFFDFERFPLPCYTGVNVVVVTYDNKVLLSARSKMNHIASGPDTIHVSVAEGMLRPADSLQLKEQSPDPFKTAVRGLYAELLMEERIDYNENDLKLISLYFDIERMQPNILFLLYSNKKYVEIANKCRFAKDSFEWDKIIPIDFNEKSIRQLIDGRFRYNNGKTYKLASNHAIASIWLSLIFDKRYKNR